MIRVVIDTNVLVAALRSSTGASPEILLAADRGEFEVALSVPLLAEYDDVCHRPDSRINTFRVFKSIMSALSLRIPDSLHRTLKSAVDHDGVSINQFVSLAVAEKLSALQTYNLIADRANKGSREAFLKAMSMVPAGEVVKGDDIPADYKPRTNRHS